MPKTEPTANIDFIRQIVQDDLKSGKHKSIKTRFPPEPNGYLHIGHTKAICLNFGIATETDGVCHLRFDDTNPTTEDPKFVEVIKADIRWLGFDWGEQLHHASDYFEQLYGYAVELIENGKAYVCSLSETDIRSYRGTLTEAGTASPDHERPSAESLDLFKRMRDGEFADGTYTLRAKIDMAAANMKLRDPLLYRIRRVPHHRTGETWKIYPMYDWAHGQSDAIEGITHSLCTLEFENNRELYDWFLQNISIPTKPRQIEFARLNLSHTVLSKRKLKTLVDDGHVDGWDDPRMPTLAGLRRRGYTPKAIRNFCERVGLAKRDSVVDLKLLEHTIREDLNHKAPRVMAVLKPLKLVIDNYPEAKVEELDAVNNPEDSEAGERKLPFSRVLYIEQDDFKEDPPKKYFRLVPGREVRLKHAYLVKCESVVKNEATGEVTEIHCSYDPETRGGQAPDGRRPKATLHWVSAQHALDAEVRLYETLFTTAEPAQIGDNLAEHLNPSSLQILTGCKVEPSLAENAPGTSYQFLRNGYFVADQENRLVFHRTVTLRDSWAKIAKKP